MLEARGTFSGPFFVRDPGKTLYANLRRMLEAIAQEGETAVQARYPVYTGAGQAGVRGRAESLSGKRWATSAVISQTHVYPWPAAGARQYRGGKTEATHHMFRDVARGLRSSRAVLAANLTAGIE